MTKKEFEKEHGKVRSAKGEKVHYGDEDCALCGSFNVEGRGWVCKHEPGKKLSPNVAVTCKTCLRMMEAEICGKKKQETLRISKCEDCPFVLRCLALNTECILKQKDILVTLKSKDSWQYKQQ